VILLNAILSLYLYVCPLVNGYTGSQRFKLLKYVTYHTIQFLGANFCSREFGGSPQTNA